MKVLWKTSYERFFNRFLKVSRNFLKTFYFDKFNATNIIIIITAVVIMAIGAVGVKLIFASTRPASSKTSVLYKSFTYLLTYLLKMVRVSLPKHVMY